MDSTSIFKWPISNFSTTASRDDPTRILDSEEFSFRNDKIKFILRFEPTCNKEGGKKKYCTLYLILKDLGGENSVKIRFKLWVENECGQSLGGHADSEFNNTFDTVDSGFGYDKFIKYRQLYDQPNDFVTNDVVIFCCEMRSTSRPSPKEIEFTEEVPLHGVVREKLWELYNSGFTGLCTIRVEDQECDVPAALLMLVSPVFREMLQPKPGGTKKIRIKASPIVVCAFIRYLIVGNIEKSCQLARDLLVLAEKYQVEELKNVCMKELTDPMNQGNLLDRLIFAYQNDNDELKEVVLDYLSGYPPNKHFREVTKSAEWQKFAEENKKLSKLIIKDVTKRNDQS